MQAVKEEVAILDEAAEACGGDDPRRPSDVLPTTCYAPIWRRAAACSIDFVIVLAMVVPSALVLTWLMEALHADLGMKVKHARYLAGIGTVALWVFGDWYYNAKMISSEWQATVGKRALGIRVLDAENQRTCFGQISTRHFAKFLSTFLFGIGFLMAAFGARRQAMHDVVSNTVVVKGR